VKFLHAADVHLDAPLRGLSRYPGAPLAEVRASTRRAFTGLIDLALEEEVAFVAIAGDLFDGASRDFQTALFLNAEAVRLRDSQIPLLIVSGNHDAQTVLTKQLGLPENVTTFSTRKPETYVLENVGVAIHGQGFARREVFDNLAAGFPTAIDGYVNVGVLHTSVTGRPGHEGYAPCTVEELCGKGYDYWALGHVHTREVVSRDPWIVFSGCTQGRHIRETNAGGASLVTVEDGAVASVDHAALDVLRWALLKVDAAGLSEDTMFDRVRQAVVDAVAEADDRLLAVRVVLLGETPGHRALIADNDRFLNEVRSIVTDVASGQAWLEQLKIATEAPTDVARLVARDDAIGGLLRAIRSTRTDDDALAAIASELADVKRKLPTAIFDEEFSLDDPGILRRLVGDVEYLLMERLAGTVDS
jgi:DNA repair exonuclease SbcCD nuclease subunit